MLGKVLPVGVQARARVAVNREAIDQADCGPGGGASAASVAACAASTVLMMGW